MTNRARGAAAACLLLRLGVMSGRPLSQDEPKQLDWKGPGGCVVDFVRTPCRTVRYHEHSFGRGLGFGKKTSSRWVVAFDHDGSESQTRASVWHRWFFFPVRARITELVLRAEGRVLYIDHERKIYEAHRKANRPIPYWEEDDGLCSGTAAHSTYLSGRLPDSIIAGVHVVGYRGRDFRGADYEIYFAPSIGCQTMRFFEVMRGISGRITAEYEMVVDSYVLGPPDPSLFATPFEYTEVPSILRSQSGRVIQ